MLDLLWLFFSKNVFSKERPNEHGHYDEVSHKFKTKFPELSAYTNFDI